MGIFTKEEIEYKLERTGKGPFVEHIGYFLDGVSEEEIKKKISDHYTHDVGAQRRFKIWKSIYEAKQIPLALEIILESKVSEDIKKKAHEILDSLDLSNNEPLFDSTDLEKLQEVQDLLVNENGEIVYDIENPEHRKLIVQEENGINKTIGDKFTAILKDLLKDDKYVQGRERISGSFCNQQGKFRGYTWHPFFLRGYENDEIVFTVRIVCREKEHIGFEIKIDNINNSEKIPTYETPEEDKERKWLYILAPNGEMEDENYEYNFFEYSKEEFVERIKKYVKDNLDHYIKLLNNCKIEYEKKINDTQDTLGEWDKSQPLNQILYGPPGTGKTYSIKKHIGKILKQPEITFDDIRDLKKKGELAFITFHPAYGYEEFISGIRPNIDGKKITYKIHQGVFKSLCDRARGKDKPYFMIIDEINRGNIPKIFGELITLIEDNKREGEEECIPCQLPYRDYKRDKNGEYIRDDSGKKIYEDDFSVPKNIYIIATMNTADKSLVALDTALRRRFRMKEMMPKPSLLKPNNKKTGVNLVSILTNINERITDRSKKIGHAFFMKCKSKKDVISTMQYQVIPLLQEYEYDDWKKICEILDISECKKGSILVEKKNQEILNDKIDFSDIAKAFVNQKKYKLRQKKGAKYRT